MFEKVLEKIKKDYISNNKDNWKMEFFEQNSEQIKKNIEQQFIKERMEEVYSLREGIIWVMKQLRPSLPAACFALDMLKDELMQRENDFILGKLPKPSNAGEGAKIPLGNIKDVLSKQPTIIRPKET